MPALHSRESGNKLDHHHHLHLVLLPQDCLLFIPLASTCPQPTRYRRFLEERRGGTVKNSWPSGGFLLAVSRAEQSTSLSAGQTRNDDDLIGSSSLKEIANLFRVDARLMNMSLVFLTQRYI